MHISFETVEGKIIKVDVDEDSSKPFDLKIHGPTRNLVIHLGPYQDPDPEFQVFVINLWGKTRTLKVKNSNTIEELKAMIEKLEGLLPDNQRLIFRSFQLEDGRTVADYKIKQESTIHLTSRLCGC